MSNRAALRYLGFGKRNIVEIAADDQGCMVVEDLVGAIARVPGPKIIIATAGHINSGAFDDFEALADLAQMHGAWLHIDAAFGLWARADVTTRAMTRGIERADSWSTDGHKWLQIPFDAGFAIVRHKQAHKRAMDISASYLNEAPGDGRNAAHFNPELSRRARGFAVWATMKALGRRGIADIVRNHCDCASLLGYKLKRLPGVEVLNDVVLNQVVLAFDRNLGSKDADRLTKAMERAINSDEQYFVRTTQWKERCVLRVSITGEENGPAHIQAFAERVKELWTIIRET